MTHQPSFFEEQQSPTYPETDIEERVGRIAAAARPIDDREPSEAAQDQGWGLPVISEEQMPTPEEHFVNQFGWVPHWKGEVTLALIGLASRVNRDAKHHIRAVEEVIKHAEGYKNEALLDATLLREAFAEPNEIDSLSPTEIVGDSNILRILAEQQLFTDSLKTGKWPIHKKGSLDKKLSPLILNLYNAEDETLVELWQETFAGANERGRFWIDQLNTVQNNPWVMGARSEAAQRLIRS